MRLAVVVLAGSLGCYAPAFKDCELTCGTGESCPSGQDCMFGRCRDTGQSGACPVGTIDAPSIDGPKIDSPVSSERWSNPVEADGIGLAFRDPTLTGDQTQMYLSRNNQIFVSNYMPAMFRWSNPSAVPEITAAGSFTNPFLSFDGLSLYVSTAVGAEDIWLCTRQPGNPTFMGLNPVASLNSGSIDTGGATTMNGIILALSSNRADQQDTDLFVTTFMSTPPAGWRPPVPMTALNSTAADGHAVFDATGLRIVFASDRSGNYDLYTSTRTSDTAAFDPPEPISDLNTLAIEADPWLSPDGQTLYFSRGPDAAARIMKSVRMP